jgi:nicotinamide-nucleotide amidase
MFTAQVLPWLEQTVPPPERYRCRTLRTTGIGESILEERVAPVLAPLVRVGLGLGYCARPGEVDVLLRMRGDQAETVLAEAAVIVHQTVAGYVFGEGEEPLEEVVVRLLAARGQTLVTAESCTGGRLANRITDVPGASAVFLGGAVTYSNALKQTVLGVRAETLAAHGAVSEPTAREMAEGARQRFGAEYALATTGIAGPSGGSEAKPVGTVFIALATAGRTVVARQLNRFERDTFKHVSAQQALEMLRRELAQR